MLLNRITTTAELLDVGGSDDSKTFLDVIRVRRCFVPRDISHVAQHSDVTHGEFIYTFGIRRSAEIKDEYIIY